MPLQPRGDGVNIPGNNKVVISTSIDVLDEAGNPMGFIQSLNRRDTRRVDRIRQLDSVDAGRTVEQAPGPEDNTLDVTGFALYGDFGTKGSLVERLVLRDDTSVSGGGLAGGAGGTALGKNFPANIFRSINSQVIPCNITERWTQPSKGSIGRSTYGDSLLTAFSRPVAITGITITESATLQPTWIE